jgi:uncharacterized protein YwlG (UPF0340 family)
MTWDGRDLGQIRSLSEKAMSLLLEAAKPRPGSIIVVGCSTSEIQGQRIGSASNIEIAEAVVDGLLPFFADRKCILPLNAAST